MIGKISFPIILNVEIQTNMSSIAFNDATLALPANFHGTGYRTIPMANLSLQRITSIADMKSLKIDFRTLRPAVMVDRTLIVKDTVESK